MQDYTLIPHGLLLASLCVLAFRLLEMTAVAHRGDVPPDANRVPMALIILAGVMAVERIYYIAARELIHHGVNLWAAHPGPLMISGAMTLAVYQLIPAVMRRSGHGATHIYRSIVRDWVVLSLIGIGIGIHVATRSA